MINVLKPKFRTDEILSEIRECLDKGWTGLGFKTVELEEQWKKYTNLNNAHYINSATSGLHLALNVFKKVHGWKDGDEIITTPLTFVSTNHAIKYENLTPIFADVDEYLCLNPIQVKKLITSKTRAVMFVGLGGNAGRLDKIAEICKEHNIKLILDAAHMAGTKTIKTYEYGQAISHVGWEADVSIFSFQAVKNLPTSDSGMICFKDTEYDTLARELSWLGINKDTYARFNKGSYKWRYDVPNVGFKYHGNALTASIGLVQLKYLEQDNDRRREIASIYQDNLKGIVDIVSTSPYTISNSRHLFQIIVEKEHRDKLINKLYDNEVYPGVHYIDNTQYKPYEKAYGTCPISHTISEMLITLPIHCNLTDDQVYKVINIIKEYKNESTTSNTNS